MVFLDKKNRVIVSTANLESLKNELGNLILKKIGRPDEKNRIEEFATIFPLYGKITGKDRILVIGLNGHFDESNEKQNERQPANENHPYFTTFKNNILKEIENKEILYFDLIPVRTGKKLCLKYESFRDELANLILAYLKAALELYDPDLVLTNDVNVSEFMLKNLCNADEESYDTFAYYSLKDRKVPIILSGHITGVRAIDKYNRIRLLREILEALNNSRTTIRDKEVTVQKLHRHNVTNCDICKGDIEELRREMSIRNYEDADRAYKAWKDHVFWTLMDES